MIHKVKNNKLNSIKIKKHLLCKTYTRRMERQAEDGEKLSANHIPGRGLLYRICEELSRSAVKKETL